MMSEVQSHNHPANDGDNANGTWATVVDNRTDDDNQVVDNNNLETVSKCSQCCISWVYEGLFLDNRTQFTCMLFAAFIPIMLVMTAGIIVGSAMLVQYPQQPVIGVCTILGALALSCFIYSFVGCYIVYYRRNYSPNIGSHGYFPFL
jgi:hypothetical protein